MNTPSTIVSLKILQAILSVERIAVDKNSKLTSAFAMNKIVVIVASETASLLGSLAFTSRIASSMCFRCVGMLLSKRADVQRRAWKIAASVMMRGSHAESFGVVCAGSIKVASEGWQFSLAWHLTEIQDLESLSTYSCVLIVACRVVFEWER